MSIDRDIVTLTGYAPNLKPITWAEICDRAFYSRHDWSDPALERRKQFDALMKLAENMPPMVDLLRRAPTPGESQSLNEAPHFDYLRDKKGGK